MPKYIELDHTADVGVIVQAISLEELFENAAFAMCDLQVDLSNVEAKERVEIHVTGCDLENSLVRWLQRLLAVMEIEDMVFSKFEVTEVNDEVVTGVVSGESLDPSRHNLKGAIKAVTYHELEIEETKEGWEAQIIFDV